VFASVGYQTEQIRFYFQSSFSNNRTFMHSRAKIRRSLRPNTGSWLYYSHLNHIHSCFGNYWQMLYCTLSPQSIRISSYLKNHLTFFKVLNSFGLISWVSQCLLNWPTDEWLFLCSSPAVWISPACVQHQLGGRHHAHVGESCTFTLYK